MMIQAVLSNPSHPEYGVATIPFPTALDRYYWNLVPDSKDLLDKVTDIKGKHLWNEVIDEYREKKNLYLCRQDYNHPSFNVYVETVNQVFNKYFD